MIKAKVLKYSMTQLGNTIITYELEYPRFIHAEFMTHRVFSRNSASSRAIPLEAMHHQILEADVHPVSWGKNMPGMQAKEELTGADLEAVKAIWDCARKDALRYAKSMASHGAHKQCFNRLTEPFMQMKVILTTTEETNWEELRNHSDADPTIQALAKAMLMAKAGLVPQVLNPGEWHLPYIDTHRDLQYSGELIYSSEGTVVDLETAKMISASCCAQVSYRKNDNSIEKAQNIYDRLINSTPRHASPVEHQATPIRYMETISGWQPGVTHADRQGNLWSGNFKHWIQNRQVLA